jgi:hypothetical protein
LLLNCHSKHEFARDEDGGGFCEVHVNTIEVFWSLLRSWLRRRRGISQELLPVYRTLSANVLDNGWYVNIHCQTHLPKGYGGRRSYEGSNSFHNVERP